MNRHEIARELRKLIVDAKQRAEEYAARQKPSVFFNVHSFQVGYLEAGIETLADQIQADMRPRKRVKRHA